MSATAENGIGTPKAALAVLDASSSTSLIQKLLMNSLPHDPKDSFIARRFATLLVGDVAILITFGSIYPPLAIAICISLLLQMSMTQIMLDRFLYLSNTVRLRDLMNMNMCVEVIKRESAAIGFMIALSLAPTSSLASVFWSFFLFDIYGDVAGLNNSLWILFVLPACILLMRLLSIRKGWMTLTRLIFSSIMNRKEDVNETGGIELRESTVMMNSLANH
jgi:hypothetical protein